MVSAMLPSSEQDVLIPSTGLAVGKLVYKRITDIQWIGECNAANRICMQTMKLIILHSIFGSLYCDLVVSCQ